ncbi:MAG: symmetrical bis(5'-nucleosyl)-tetraphosphatase [Gammaproteobacteria bacterium]|nr:symmetrical bis(5'-nucleosyl)-tetraphosphatase [Gammaproteobacteria bacterium]
MATYAIGDIQGCFRQLIDLLRKINFNPAQDTLWIAGDLINRGPQSLETLRFLKNLGESVKIVLGNHDLHLLAVHYGVRELYPDDTISDILNAPDREPLIAWLRQQPLIYYSAPYVMVHAGFCPTWTLEEALALGREVSDQLKGPDIVAFLQAMYGNEPDTWSSDLKGMVRLRVITNYLTRMRFCAENGCLNLSKKTTLLDCPEGYFPWFQVPNRKIKTPIVFGHWSALQGETHTENVFALDTGVVWGGALTAMNLETKLRYNAN